MACVVELELDNEGMEEVDESVIGVVARGVREPEDGMISLKVVLKEG